MSTVTAVPLQPVKRSYKIWLWLGVIAAIALAAAGAWYGTRAEAAKRYTDEQFLAWHKGQSGIKTMASGLQYQVLKAGEGPNPVEGDGVAVDVRGTLRDGAEFQPQSPMQFRIGQPMFAGFTEGVKLMNKGAKYRFWLPASLGPQPNQAPPEIVGKVLIFDVEMKEHLTAAQIQQMMMQQQLMQQMQGGAPEGGPGR